MSLIFGVFKPPNENAGMIDASKEKKNRNRIRYTSTFKLFTEKIFLFWNTPMCKMRKMSTCITFSWTVRYGWSLFVLYGEICGLARGLAQPRAKSTESGRMFLFRHILRFLASWPLKVWVSIERWQCTRIFRRGRGARVFYWK